MIGFLFLLIFTVSLGANASSYETYCGRIILERGTKLDLSAMEKRLVCGDERNDQIGQPWSDIPPRQAQNFLKSFLQSRGYHNPKFAIREGNLYVSPGQVTKLTKFEVTRAPEDWEQPRRRLIYGRPFTPSLLDELETWSLREAQNLGYACADVAGFGDPDTGLARIEIEDNGKKRILDVLDLSETDLAPGVADRYNAFRFGNEYSEKLVQLTRRRLLEDGLMQAVSFSHACYQNGVILKRDAVLGPPREFRIGIGGNTEDVRLRIRGKRIRLGRSASNIEGVIDASFRRQITRVLGRWFYSIYQPRVHLEPLFEFERRDEEKFESRAWKASLFHVWNRELRTGQAELSFGPSWNTFRLDRGVGPAASTLVFLESQLKWQSHNNEYFEQSPRGGSRFEAQLLRSQENWGAPYTATRFQIQGQSLAKIFNYDPPLLVLGARYSLGTTRTEEGVDLTGLPIQFRFFAGGNEDLRGFNRQTLPRSGVGGLTEALLGIEARLYRVILGTADPFIFVDTGKLGSKSFQLDDPIYWSPGGGLRWESPIGVFRGFAAYGMISSRPPAYVGDEGKWRLGLSYGEEF